MCHKGRISGTVFTRQQAALVIALVFAVTGCVKSSLPVDLPHPEAAKPSERSSCAEAQRLADEAAALRTEGRLLREQLLLERARALCESAVTPAQPPPTIDAEASLEEVYQWMAKANLATAMGPARFEPREVAEKLERVVLSLTQGKHSLVTEPNIGTWQPIVHDDWISIYGDGIGRVGEWFERYALPQSDADQVRGFISERVVLFARYRYGRQCSNGVYDFRSDKTVIERPCAESPLGPVQLGANRVALPVGDPKQSENDRIEVWQVQPAELLTRFSHPPQHEHSLGPRLRELKVLENDMLLAQWEGAVSLIDMKAAKEVATFAAYGSSSLSPKGRFFAYHQDIDKVGLYDRKTGKSRTLHAEGLFDTGRVAAWSSDERWLATGSLSGKGHLWETVTGRLVRSFTHHVPAEDYPGNLSPLIFAPNDTEVFFQRNEEWLSRFDVRSGKELSPLYFQEGAGTSLTVLSRQDKSKILYSSNGACLSFELLDKGVVTHPRCSKSGFLAAISEDGEWMLRLSDYHANELQFLSTRREQVIWRVPLAIPRLDSEGIFDPKLRFIAFGGGPVINVRYGNVLLPASERHQSAFYVQYGKDVVFFPAGVNFLSNGLALDLATSRFYSTESIENGHASEQEADTPGVHWRLSSSSSTLTAQAKDSALAWSRERVTGFHPFEKLGVLVMSKPEGLEVVHLGTLKTLFTVRLFGIHQSAFVQAPDGRFEILGNREAMASDLRCRVHTRVLPLSACTERYEWTGLLRELLKSHVSTQSRE